MISIKGLHKFFNKGRQNEIHVINDVTLDLPERGMVAIFGKSGCGKTTLLNVIGGLDRFAEGSLTIEGQDIKKNTDVLRNKYVGYIFQNYNLNKGESCFDNVADALRLCGIVDEGVIESRVMAALSCVGMEKYSRRTPDTLSGGQQQRIAIARAIVKNPRIILADEPTGNLDEANTVMIMDLLKAIARDHLVLLVTHEANLVDYYCDTVVELSDGRVVGIKQNSDANGFAARDKNHIYLGELDRHEISGDGAKIEYYGQLPETPIKLKIVNDGGKLYVRIDTAKVQILDETSEIRLREGIYEEKVNMTEKSESIDMSALPPVECSGSGRLFNLRSSVRSGYSENFKNQKKGKRVLRTCMSLFAAVIVFMTAVFGSAFGEIINARNSYNHNVFYLMTGDAETSAKLNSAVGKSESGIDFIRLSTDYPGGDALVGFRTGSFETFGQDYGYTNDFYTNAVYLDITLARGKTLVEGRADISDSELLITTRVADALLEKSTLGYIKERKDLIGLVSNELSVGGSYLRIAGIVESNEPAVYLTEIAMARYASRSSSALVTLDRDMISEEIKKGETTLAIRYRRENAEYPKVGETIKIQGRDLKVTEIKEACYDYDTWLKNNGIQRDDEYTFFEKLLKRENPRLSEKDPEYSEKYNEISNLRFFEFYDYYYAEVENFLADMRFFEPNSIDLWMYFEKGVDAVKYNYINSDYYKATVYKAKNGQYPSREYFWQISDTLPYPYEETQNAIEKYEKEFYSGNHNSSPYWEHTYIVGSDDYIGFSKQIGATHKSATNGEYIYYEEMVPKSDGVTRDVVVDMDYYGMTQYTVIHSSDPEKTAKYIEDNFDGLGEINVYFSPDQIFDSIIENQLPAIIGSLITMAILLILMSLCMYFIMRSSLMNRIKEVGIYRAIGVSKRNLVFKFFIEAIVLTTLTVLVGYLMTSGFLYACFAMSSLVAEIFYFPPWLAGAILVILYLISLFFGTLPILSLLKKTPSEILAKYDI